MPRVGDSLEEVDGDEGLAASRRHSKQRSSGFAGSLAFRKFLHDGADGGVLIVAPRPLATGVRLEQRPGGWRFEGEAHALLVTGTKLGGAGKLGNGLRGGG